jgi:hypothetical protein
VQDGRPGEHVYAFGPFLLDTRERRLLRDGTAVPLTLKAFDLLQVLVENQGHLLHKEDLLRRVWPDAVVEENNLTVTISALRKALDEGPTDRLAHVAGGDAMIACFDAKYQYLSWRPVHAIQRADTDGNPQTQPDPTWQPLRPTPNHPEYPSAHACHSTAVTVALEKFFGTDAVPFSLDSLVTGETRQYDRFRDVVREVNHARVWAGFHFRNSDLEGSHLGRKVGRFVARNFFRPAVRGEDASR